MKLSNHDLDMIFSDAVNKFVNNTKPILMSEKQFRSLCHTQAVCSFLYSHGLLKEEVDFNTKERIIDSVEND